MPRKTYDDRGRRRPKGQLVKYPQWLLDEINNHRYVKRPSGRTPEMENKR